jgi:hypothetical protein
MVAISVWTFSYLAMDSIKEESVSHPESPLGPKCQRVGTMPIPHIGSASSGSAGRLWRRKSRP